MTLATNAAIANHASQGRVLIVDDEVELTNALVEMLAKQGFETVGFIDGLLALESLRRQKFDVLLADLMMPAIDGLSLLKAALEIDPNLVGVLMTGQGTVQTAVEAMKSGAFDYLLKPFKLNTLLATLHRSLDMRRLRMENIQLRELVRIYELARQVTTRLDTNSILRQTCQAVLQVCEADEASIMLPTEKGESLVLAAASDAQRAHLIGQVTPCEGSLSGWVAQHHLHCITEGRIDPQVYPASHPREAIRSSLSLPMMLGEQFAGVVNINHIQRATSFTPGQINGLNILAHIAAAAMENARLYQQTEKQLRRIAALRTIDQAISSSVDLRVTLNIVLDQAVTQLNVDTAAILLANQQSQLLEYAAGRGFHNSRAEQANTFVGTGIAGKAALERRIVLVTDLARAEPDPMIETLRAGETIAAVFAAPLIAKGEVQGVLVLLHPTPFTPDDEWRSFFEALAGQAAIAIDSIRLFNNLQRTNQQLFLAYNTTIEGWSRALDLRDRETEGHTQRVTEMALRLARAVGQFDDETLVHFRRGALLHDIGKMAIPDEILHKPGDLSADEEAIMRKHPQYAYDLLYPISYLREALAIPYSHHERWDGSGYPQGLAGQQIPLAARIFALVDVWDALRSDRPYRTGWPEAEVLAYLEANAGKHFDPQITVQFLDLLHAQETGG